MHYRTLRNSQKNKHTGGQTTSFFYGIVILVFSVCIVLSSRYSDDSAYVIICLISSKNSCRYSSLKINIFLFSSFKRVSYSKLLIPTTGFRVAVGSPGFGIVKLLSTILPLESINLPFESFTSLVSKNLVEFIESPYLLSTYLNKS